MALHQVPGLLKMTALTQLVAVLCATGLMVGCQVTIKNMNAHQCIPILFWPEEGVH